MPEKSKPVVSIVGRRLRERREALGLAQEKVGVAIGLDESSARARISRYELGVHEPPVRVTRQIAEALGVPLAYMYCEDDRIADFLMRLHALKPTKSAQVLGAALAALDGQGG